jgi:PHP family Zn ribbon phosphoesterase
MKIILTAQSEDSTFAFLQQIPSKTLGKGIKTTYEKVTWNELTQSSKSKMLEKKVIF